MSIAALEQVFDETRRLAIAGSNVAPGDFRLKKLVPPLEKAGAKAPVFAKVAETITSLVDGTEKEAPQTLLDLGTLVTAVLYTQGSTGAAGKLQAIPTTDIGPLETGTSARVLKPLIEALTTTGSGRLEIIRDAVERDAFRDLRLVNPALVAIDDPYPETAELVCEKVLPRYGKAIYDQVREPIDVKGRGGHVRRLKLMHAIDPEATKDLVEQSLEEGSKEMKIAALVCLKGSKEGLPHLLEQANAKAKDVRAAAYEGMSETKHADVTETFQKALAGKDLEIAAIPASRNPDPKLLAWLLEQAKSQFEGLFTATVKQRNKAIDQFVEFLDCFNQRSDKKTVAFLEECFDRREELLALGKSPDETVPILWKVANLLCYTDAKPVLKKIADAHETLPASVIGYSFLAAATSWKPAAVYDAFSPYLLAKKPSKKSRKRDPAEERREAVRDFLMGTRHRYHWWMYDDDLGITERARDLELDDRWLDAAIEADDLELVTTLLRPDHEPAGDYLAATVRKLVKNRDATWQLLSALEAMLDVSHPRATELYFQVLADHLGKKRHVQPYHAYWFGRLIPRLPAESAEELEALLPKLHDKAVDVLADYVVELKAKK